MLRSVLAVLTLGGCDSLFNLDHVAIGSGSNAGDDAMTSDVRSVDATVDGKPCVPINHDEDGDAIDDACDSCLAVVNLGSDLDGDGVDAACDPNLATRDTILYATGFPSMTAYTADFTQVGSVTYDPGNRGQLIINGNTVVTLSKPARPTKVVVRATGVGAGIGAEANVLHSGATCQVLGSDCGKTTATTTCLVAQPGGASGGLTVSSANVQQIELIGPSTITCKALAGGQTATAGTAVQFASASLQLTTTASGRIVVDSIVIYGAEP